MDDHDDAYMASTGNGEGTYLAFILAILAGLILATILI